MTIRDGAEDEARGLHTANVDEVESLARAHGLVVLPRQKVADLLGRKEVQWHQIALRLPDDGTNALPILRHIVLNDSKTGAFVIEGILGGKSGGNRTNVEVVGNGSVGRKSGNSSSAGFRS